MEFNIHNSACRIGNTINKKKGQAFAACNGALLFGGLMPLVLHGAIFHREQKACPNPLRAILHL